MSRGGLALTCLTSNIVPLSASSNYATAVGNAQAHSSIWISLAFIVTGNIARRAGEAKVT
jgi:hypothetical protein